MLAKTIRTAADASSPEVQQARDRLNSVLFVTVDAVRMSGTSCCRLDRALGLFLTLFGMSLSPAILLQPVVPQATAKILDHLAVPASKRGFAQASMLCQDQEPVLGASVDNAKSFVAFPKLSK